MDSSRAAWMFLALCLGLLTPGMARAGCEKDTDCKGDRICEAGRCTAPSRGGARPEPGSWVPPDGMPPPPEAPPLCTTDADCGEGKQCKDGECRPGKPAGAATGPRKTGPVFATKKARYTPGQIKALRAAGCPLDSASALMADRLADRGFAPRDFIRACKEDRTLRQTLPETRRFPRGTVETLAAARALGLDTTRRRALLVLRHGDGRPLTDAYNRAAIGGHVTEVVGWSLGGAGAAALLTGLILIPVWVDHAEEGAGVPLDREGYGVASIVLMATGSALLIAGAPALVMGRQKQKTWLPAGTL